MPASMSTSMEKTSSFFNSNYGEDCNFFKYLKVPSDFNVIVFSNYEGFIFYS